MAIRIGVFGDDEDECVEALAQLVDRGYIPVMMSRPIIGNGWQAKAVPAPKPASAVDESAAG